MNYITLFQTRADYNTAKDRLLIPNVSYIVDSDEIEFMSEHIVDFGTDVVAKSICVSNWDTDHDGELSFEEAAAVTSIGTIFRNTGVTSGMWLRYFKGLTTIDEYAFRDNTNMINVAIPSNITTIRNGPWYNTPSLKDIYCYWTVPPSTSDISSFINNTVQHVYIPKGTRASYAANLRFPSAKLVELDEMP